MVPIAPRLREPLRAALRGERAPWPEDLSDAESYALIVHGVAPLVYAASAVPQLRTEAIRAATLETLRFADLRAVLDALAAANVEVLVIKGTALAYDLYGTPELRPRGDTDLLIAVDVIERARAVFLALGFEEQPDSGDEHGTRQTAFVRADGSGIVHIYDVHWSVTNTPLFASTLQFDELLTRSIALPALGANARGLCDVDALLLACVHRVAHHHDSDRIVWLVDIALLRDRMSRDEHARFWRAAADARIVGACMRSIDLMNDWMSRPDVNRAEEFLSAEEIAREEPSRAFLDRDITHGGVMLANLRALPWRARIERMWQIAFPPASFMRSTFGARSNLALPWLYVVRGARGVARLFRRVGV